MTGEYAYDVFSTMEREADRLARPRRVIAAKGLMTMRHRSSAPLPIHLLTETERECLRQVHAGFSSKDIAAERGVRPDRIDKIINSARAKLGNPPRRETARRFVEFETALGADAADPPSATSSPPTQSLGSQPLGLVFPLTRPPDDRVEPPSAAEDAITADHREDRPPRMLPDIARSLRLAAAGRLRNDLSPYARSTAIAIIAAAGACTAGAAMALLIILNHLALGM